MNTALRHHWDAVYRTRADTQTSWHCAHLDTSLRLLDALGLDAGAPVIDVGGGRSTFVDDLLARGLREVSVLDVAGEALAQARARLGASAAQVHWIAGDATTVELPAAHFAAWHDRAAFHFLVDADARRRYATTLACTVRPGGHAIIATFAPDGPERCSGLPVRRYDAAALAADFTPAFSLVAAERDLHRTPAGGEQAFTYVLLRRAGA
ncbi:class I SAM-dependent methyltransferase [Dokdonella fugitiva]|uniref:class I SAM-dependent methyltransferase n=1 Tax=Dokdonella fugitiva TaxID=328517 RepID=UPI0015FDD589|nr:class I SAM-dependent methyltransferase [Dokdonella fugitiva]MBA8884246.1 ubiquinone/menaquinone biosynthesis C-methylase UbiE [Dokdonella fugitiva]